MIAKTLLLRQIILPVSSSVALSDNHDSFLFRNFQINIAEQKLFSLRFLTINWQKFLTHRMEIKPKITQIEEFLYKAFHSHDRNG